MDHNLSNLLPRQFYEVRKYCATSCLSLLAMTTHVRAGVFSNLSFDFKISNKQLRLSLVAVRANRFSAACFVCRRTFGCRCTRLAIRIGHERLRAGVGCCSQPRVQERGSVRSTGHATIAMTRKIQHDTASAIMPATAARDNEKVVRCNPHGLCRF